MRGRKVIEVIRAGGSADARGFALRIAAIIAGLSSSRFRTKDMILAVLSEGERTCSQISRATGLTQVHVRVVLSRLEQAGVVEAVSRGRGQGKETVWRLRGVPHEERRDAAS